MQMSENIFFWSTNVIEKNDIFVIHILYSSPSKETDLLVCLR